MNKDALISQIAKTTQLKKEEIKKVITTLIEVASTALAQGESLRLMNFGSFRRKHRKARQGHLPGSTEMFPIPASFTVNFLPGKALREKLNFH